MKGLKICLIGLFCLLVTGSRLSGQVVIASATGEIYAEIVSAFSASQNTILSFGKFSPGAEGGELIISPQNTISVLGSIYLAGGMHSAGSFYVSGEWDSTFSISLPSEPVVLTNTSDAKTMIVDDWVSVPDEGMGTGQLQNGFQVVYVGATLKVGNLNDNPIGIYTGSYKVTFDFN
jgi:hypothetical protein